MDTKMKSGKIAWFNASSGEGVVCLDNGDRLYCHFSAIDTVDKNNYQWPNEFDQGYLNTIAGRACLVEEYVNCYSRQCNKVTLV